MHNVIINHICDLIQFVSMGLPSVKAYIQTEDTPIYRVLENSELKNKPFLNEYVANGTGILTKCFRISIQFNSISLHSSSLLPKFQF